MEDYNFMPNWYKDEILKKQIHKNKLQISIVLFINISIIVSIIINYSNYKEICNEVKIQSKIRGEKREIYNRRQQKRVSTLKTYEFFSRNTNSDIEYQEATIDGNSILLSSTTSVAGYYDYINNINKLKGFRIKNITEPKYEEGEQCSFSMQLERDENFK
ncbi:MAG: hypothetical protein Q8936_01555 [Bacillota bacterium]|nr:hypothetical protein [Bacillota bacterium]